MMNLLTDAAREGGEVLRKYFRTHLNFASKSNLHDLVSIADKESQSVIVNYIKNHAADYNLKNFGFIGEEQLTDHSNLEYTFVIDPLDGTSSYSTGINYFCVSIALAKNKKIIAGAIYDVLNDTMFTSIKGEGAYCNGKLVKMNAGKTLAQSMIFVTMSSNQEARNRCFEIMKDIDQQVRGFRFLGATALDMSNLTIGVGDAVLNTGCKIWDIAAAGLIFSEAGGVFSKLDGSPIELDFSNPQHIYTVIAGEKNIYSELITLVMRKK